MAVSVGIVAARDSADGILPVHMVFARGSCGGVAGPRGRQVERGVEDTVRRVQRVAEAIHATARDSTSQKSRGSIKEMPRIAASNPKMVIADSRSPHWKG